MTMVRFGDRLGTAARQALHDAGPRLDVHEGAFLIHDGDAATTLYYVVEGLLKVVKTTLDGHVTFLGLRGAGALVGELAVLTGAPRSSALQAVRPSQVIRIDKESFEHQLATNPELSRALLGELAHQLHDNTMQIHLLMNADARTRMADRLVRLADDTLDRPQSGVCLVLPVSQEELGEWAGLSRAGAVKALRALRDDGLIETSRMSITITDLAALRLVAAN